MAVSDRPELADKKNTVLGNRTADVLAGIRTLHGIYRRELVPVWHVSGSGGRLPWSGRG
ncbi:hypothetical protein ACWIID_33040 [Streptomyces phaeochromogenes]